jgi:hypothetical protein
MLGTRQRSALVLLLSTFCGSLVLSGTASAACPARPLVVVRATAGGGQTAVKLPPFLRATLICGDTRGLRGFKGVPGKAGADGATGPAGPVGSTGATGPEGAAGATGPIGPMGPTGINGVVGTPGLAGINGTNGINAPTGYAYVYDTSAPTVGVEADVVFSSAGLTSGGITHVAGTAGITLTVAGTYKVTYSVSAVERNQMAVFINGAASPGGGYESADAGQQNTGQMIVAVTAGSVLTIRNHTSPGAVHLQNTAGGSALLAVDASVLIERLA